MSTGTAVRRPVRSVLALLREALWLRATLAVVAFSVACLFLGRWQFHRYQAKAERADRIEHNYGAPVAPLADLLPGPAVALPLPDEWRRVGATGRYEPAGTVLVRNRPRDGEFGYEVLVPLRLADGAALLVDRGWIPFGQRTGAPVDVPEPPAGQVTVVARLRPPEPPRPGTGSGRTVSRIAVGELVSLAGGPLYQAYGLLASESPTVPDRPLAAEPPDTDTGVHLPYAVQWWGFGIAGYVMLVVYARREVQRRAEEAGAARKPATKPAVGPGPGPEPGPGFGPTAKPARTRIRDEDVEDAQVERALRAPGGSQPPPGRAAPPRSDR